MSSIARKLRYGLLGLPLGFAGLPLYVHVPQFYADTFHIDLATLGVVLLALRLIDAISDPIIGILSDRLVQRFGLLLLGAGTLLILGYGALFNPPLSMPYPLVWLALSLVVVYFSFSAITINYYALGARLAPDYHDQTRLAVFREAFMLIGVLLASLLPSILAKLTSSPAAYGLYGWTLAPLLVACSLGCLSLKAKSPPPFLSTPLLLVLRQRPQIIWVLVLALFNSIPAAITSTLFLFFTRDVLGAEKWSGPLLALYFLSAAGGMPVWTYLSKRYRKRNSLMVAMVIAISCFIWSYMLERGQVEYFALICFLSGLTFGADVVMVPSLLSDTISNAHHSSASVFGLWNFVNKLTMGLAAGIVLPLLAFYGYHSSEMNAPSALHALSGCYALVPCALKLIALLLLFFSPIDRKKSYDS